MIRLLPAILVVLAAGFVVPNGTRILRVPPPRTGGAAVALGAGLLIPRGPGAALLTLPWLATAVVVGSRMVRAQRGDPLDAVTRVAVAGFLVVGATWATIAAAGLDPVHVGDVHVILTAAHFHYAGFAFGAIALRTRRDGSRLAGAAIVGWLAGVPLVALSIGTHSTNPLGALALGVAGAAIGAALLAAAARHRSVGLAVAGASIAFGVALSTGYALAQSVGFVWLPVDAMERTHGILNAIGFATVGVATWRALDRRAAPSSDAVVACS